jgi:predicted phage terminase large subunit-like protein
VLVNPEGGKEARAAAVSPLFEAGNVWLPDPSIAPWIMDYIEELATFPKAANDDQMDSTSQALLRLYTKASRLGEAMARMRSEGVLG